VRAVGPPLEGQFRCRAGGLGVPFAGRLPAIMPCGCVGGRSVRANLRDAPSGVAQLAERRTVNPLVVGSSPTPGAVKGTPWGPFGLCGHTVAHRDAGR
jgi:hypothetical protein